MLSKHYHHHHQVKGRDPHTVVATAAAVVIKRVTSQLDKDVGKKINKRSFDIGRNGSNGFLRESSPKVIYLFIYFQYLNFIKLQIMQEKHKKPLSIFIRIFYNGYLIVGCSIISMAFFYSCGYFSLCLINCSLRFTCRG
jgi:hypothetical protein